MVAYDCALQAAVEATVALPSLPASGGSLVPGQCVRGPEVVPGVQPGFADMEYDLVTELTRAHPEFAAAVARRGVAPETVFIEPWSPGYFDSEDDPSRRLAKPLM